MGKITALTDDQMTHFMAWRADAIATMPYMASILFAFRPVITRGVDTFAVDDHLRLYINFENTEPKGAKFNAEALLHEASHILAEHSMLADLSHVTAGERKAWNAAADMAINDDLRDAGCTRLAAHGVFAAQIGEPDYQTPMHYMEVLRRRMEEAQRRRQQQQAQPGQGSRSPQGGQPGDQDGEDSDEQSGGQGQGNPGDDQAPGSGGGQNGDDDEDGVPVKGCGSGAGGEKGGFELDEDNDLGGAADAANGIEKELVMIATAAAIQKHQEQHGIGSVPGGFASAVDRILAPSVTPWERVLASFMRRAVASKAGYHDTSYRRRNRRRMNETMTDRRGNVLGKVIAPGHIKPVPSVHFYRDTSGSVSDHDLAVATHEVETIARKLGIRGDDLLVSDVDTMVHQTSKFTGHASIEQVEGRGGTNMGEAIRHACDLHRKPSVIVIATDGETGWPAERPSVPVVVLLVNCRDDYWRDNVPDWAHLVEVKIDA